MHFSRYVCSCEDGDSYRESAAFGRDCTCTRTECGTYILPVHRICAHVNMWWLSQDGRLITHKVGRSRLCAKRRPPDPRSMDAFEISQRHRFPLRAATSVGWRSREFPAVRNSQVALTHALFPLSAPWTRIICSTKIVSDTRILESWLEYEWRMEYWHTEC